MKSIYPLALLALAACNSAPTYSYTTFEDITTVDDPSLAASVSPRAITLYEGTAVAFRPGAIGTDGNVYDGGAISYQLTPGATVAELDQTGGGLYVLVGLSPGATQLQVIVNGQVDDDITITVEHQ